MAQARRFMKKRQPDIVLYFDRLDIPMRDFGDLPLLRIVTETFGPAVWFNAIVVLTHACTAPPDGTNGQPIRCAALHLVGARSESSDLVPSRRIWSELVRSRRVSSRSASSDVVGF
eukprot:6012580-Pyramimonas_sp.AAC.2